MNVLRKIFLGKKSVILWSIIIFIFAFGMRCFWINQKVGIHVDEGLTHFISSYSGFNWSENYDIGNIYLGKDLKYVTFKNETDLKNSLEDLKWLRFDNDCDFAHTNFYYSFYRLWMTGGETLSLKTLINRGCGLNLVFFSASFWLMYKLLRKLFKDRRLIPLGLAAAFLNTGSISNTLFIRPYQLQETVSILLTLVFVNFYQKIENKENIITWKNFFILSLTLGLTLLSAYFSVIYLGILGIALLYLIFRTSQSKNIWFFIVTFICGLGFALTFYTGYFGALSSDRATQVFEAVGLGELIWNLFSSSLHLILIYFNFIFYLPLIILLGIFTQERFKKEFIKENNLSVILIVSGFMWAFIVMLLAPYKIIRYIIPIFPILSLSYPLLLVNLKNNIARILVPAIIFIFLVIAFFATSIESYDSGENKYISKRIPLGGNIENLHLDLEGKCKFLNKPNLPVIFVNDYNIWRFSNIVPYFKDEQKYEFYEEEDSAIYTKYEHFFILYGVKLSIKQHPIPSNLVIKDKFNCANFIGYELVSR